LEKILFDKAIRAFNLQEYYLCHDCLEELWHEADLSDRNFYQGILQIAVGLHHLQNYNWQGTAILLGEGIGRLRRYCPEYNQIDVAELMIDANELLIAVQQVGIDYFPDFVNQLEIMPQIKYVD
jgi:uncharacterized protein